MIVPYQPIIKEANNNTLLNKARVERLLNLMAATQGRQIWLTLDTDTLNFVPVFSDCLTSHHITSTSTITHITARALRAYYPSGSVANHS